MNVILYRHAFSQANAGEPTDDPASIQLVPQGVEQAERLAASILTPPNLVVTSKYIRTTQTAEPTRKRYPWVPHEEWPVHEFTYLEPAVVKVTTTMDRRNIALDYWVRNDPNYRDGPGAETFAEFIGRIRWMYDALDTRYDGAYYNHYGCAIQRIDMFSHGMYIRGALFCLLTGSFEATPDFMRNFRSFCFLVSTPNTSATPLVRHGGRWHVGPPDVSHLSPEMLTH